MSALGGKQTLATLSSDEALNDRIKCDPLRLRLGRYGAENGMADPVADHATFGSVSGISASVVVVENEHGDLLAFFS